MAAPINSELPIPPTIDEINKKRSFARWKRNGGDPEAYIKQHNDECQEKIKKSVSEKTADLEKKRKASQKVISNIVVKMKDSNPLSVSIRNAETLKCALEVLQETSDGLSQNLSALQQSLDELSNHKQMLMHQLEIAKRQKKNISFAGENVLYSLGQNICTNINK